MKTKLKQPTTSRTDFFYYAFRNTLLVGLPLLIVSALLLSFSRTFADNSTADNVSFEIPSSCTLSSTLNTDHTATVINGQYISDVGTTTIKTLCNDSNGFSIYTIGASNSTEGNNKLISSVSSQYDIATGTATSGNISNWAMKLTPVSGTYAPTMSEGYNNQYVDVPNIWTKVASRTSNTDVSADSNVAGSALTTTYALYASSAQPAGTYNGQVKYVLIHPNSDAMNLISLQMALYNALGEPTTTVDGSATGTKYYRMQDMTSSICNAVTVIGGGSQIQLVDDRPDSNGIRKLYWATKLDDGNCWMTQNLDLDFNEFDTNGDPIRDANNNVITRTFNSNDTDLSTIESTYTASGTIYPLKATDAIYGYSYENGVASWTPSAATVRNLSQWTDSNTTPSSYDNGEIYPEDNAATAGTHGLAGNYYNITSAIASNNSSNLQNSNAINSICPRGWRLPNVANNAGGYEFSKLLYVYDITADEQNTPGYANDNGFNKMITAPLWFVRSGYIYNGGVYENQVTGYYLSSTIGNINNAYGLKFSRSNVLPMNNQYFTRYYGISVRCLAR